ncbi:MAG: hypothetical protein KBC38_01710 [Candidatus Pacebacteria bacterium]|nr:hypothetical protein [Candidatus Paceibacterota bacterium]MBP9840009.1 hypothetical protein [Candidatus Paceibacterota bacterium]
MPFQDWATTLEGAFSRLLVGSIEFLPLLVGAILIFIIGWLVGVGLGRVVAQVVSALRVDQALRSAGVDRLVERAGFKLSAGNFLGGLVKWFFIVVFLVAALDVLGLDQVTTFLRVVVLTYLPKVIAAVLILLVAAVVSEAAQRAVSGSAKAANLSSANLLGTITRWAIWIFAILTALDQLEIGAAFVQTLFTGIVVAIALALGLSFGLGGQQAAARAIEKVREEVKD